MDAELLFALSSDEEEEVGNQRLTRRILREKSNPFSLSNKA